MGDSLSPTASNVALPIFLWWSVIGVTHHHFIERQVNLSDNSESAPKSQPVFTQETTPASDIAIIIDAVENALIPMEVPASHVFTALICMCLGILKPTITADELASGVELVSEFMVTLVVPPVNEDVN